MNWFALVVWSALCAFAGAGLLELLRQVRELVSEARGVIAFYHGTLQSNQTSSTDHEAR